MVKALKMLFLVIKTLGFHEFQYITYCFDERQRLAGKGVNYSGGPQEIVPILAREWTGLTSQFFQLPVLKWVKIKIQY
jgi:hypothetical protein